LAAGTAKEKGAMNEAREQFNEGVTTALLHDEIVRGLVLQMLIAEELGPEGCYHTGFNGALYKGLAGLLGTVPKPRDRFRLWQRCRDMGDAEIAEAVLEMLERWRCHV
jgi:hypothetical protein